MPLAQALSSFGNSLANYGERRRNIELTSRLVQFNNAMHTQYHNAELSGTVDTGALIADYQDGLEQIKENFGFRNSDTPMYDTAFGEWERDMQKVERQRATNIETIELNVTGQTQFQGFVNELRRIPYNEEDGKRLALQYLEPVQSAMLPDKALVVRSTYWDRMMGALQDSISGHLSAEQDLIHTAIVEHENNLDVEITNLQLQNQVGLDAAWSQFDLANPVLSNENKRRRSQAKANNRNTLVGTTSKTSIATDINQIARDIKISKFGQDDPAVVLARADSEVKRISDERNYTVSQQVQLRLGVLKAINPDLEEVGRNNYKYELKEARTMLKLANDRIKTEILNEPEIGSFDRIAAVKEALDDIPNQVRLELEEDGTIALMQEEIRNLDMERARAINDTANTEFIRSEILQGTQALIQNPETLEETLGELSNILDITELPYDVEQELKAEGYDQLRASAIGGLYMQFMEDPSNRPYVDRFWETIAQNEALSRGLNLENVRNKSHANWEESYNHTSNALKENHLRNIRNLNDGDIEQITADPKMKPNHIAQVIKPYNEINRERLLAEQFDTRGDYEAIPAEEFDAKFNYMGGLEQIAKTPLVFKSMIDKARYISPDAMNGIWSIIQSGTDKEATNLLQLLSSVDSVALNNLDSQQNLQLLVYRFSSTAGSEEQRLQMTRSVGLGQDTKITQQLDSLFTERVVDTKLYEIGEYMDELGIDNPPRNTAGITRSMNHTRNMARVLFTTGAMSMGDAIDAALEDTRRMWGNNINGRPMYIPPSSTRAERLFNPDTGDYDTGWIQRDIARLNPELRDPYLFADTTTINQHNAGLIPSYVVYATNEFGAVYEVGRYLPEPHPDTVTESIQSLQGYIDTRSPYADLVSP